MINGKNKPRKYNEIVHNNKNNKEWKKELVATGRLKEHFVRFEKRDWLSMGQQNPALTHLELQYDICCEPVQINDAEPPCQETGLPSKIYS